MTTGTCSRHSKADWRSYRSRAGGSVDARADLLAFFERSEALPRPGEARTGRNSAAGQDRRGHAKDPPLQLAHDVAIKSKHGKQDEPPWAGEFGGDIVSQSANWFAATGKTAHSWRVTYTPPDAGQLGERSIDALVLSRDVLVAWRSLLVDVGLLD